MSSPTEAIPGYAYGAADLPPSTVSILELDQLKVSAGFTPEDGCYLKMAAEVLRDQTAQVVEHWRARIIAGIPHLAAHSRSLEGTPLPDYLARSNRRFQQWIMDTCLKRYDEAWLDYQQEIAARHSSAKKNFTDRVRSTRYVPLRDIIAFVPVMNMTLEPYLAARGHASEDVARMHQAWCKSMQIQIALWTRFYADLSDGRLEW
jgi:hypothetical protein